MKSLSVIYLSGDLQLKVCMSPGNKQKIKISIEQILILINMFIPFMRILIFSLRRV